MMRSQEARIKTQNEGDIIISNLSVLPPVVNDLLLDYRSAGNEREGNKGSP